MIKNWKHRERVKQILKQQWETINHECMICKDTEVARHEKLYGKNRQTAVEFSLFAWLCPYHHQDHTAGAHHNEVLQLKLKLQAKQDFIDACIQAGYTPFESEELFIFEFGGVKNE